MKRRNHFIFGTFIQLVELFSDVDKLFVFWVEGEIFEIIFKAFDFSSERQDV
jgi:hypothetical protein